MGMQVRWWTGAACVMPAPVEVLGGHPEKRSRDSRRRVIGAEWIGWKFGFVDEIHLRLAGEGIAHECRVGDFGGVKLNRGAHDGR